MFAVQGDTAHEGKEGWGVNWYALSDVLLVTGLNCTRLFTGSNCTMMLFA